MTLSQRQPEPYSEAPALDSGFHLVPPRPKTDWERFEDAFADTWARLASALSMDRPLGRAHAYVYLSTQPMTAAALAARLDSTPEACREHLDELLALGVVRSTADGVVAECDPWKFALQAVRHRQSRELGPLIEATRKLVEIGRALEPDEGADSSVKLARVERFASFVGDVAGLLDALVNVGAGPMLRMVRTVARLVR